MTIKALPFIVLNAFFFGSTLVASRFSVGQFEPLVYISIRLIIASSFHVIIYAFSTNRKLPTDRGHIIRAMLYGVFGTAVNLVCVVSSLQYLSSGLTSVLITTAPAITALFAHFALPIERLTSRQWLGVMLALGGAIMLTLAGENGLPDGTADPRGYLLVAIAMTSGAVMTVFARRELSQYDAFDTASIRMFTAMFTVVPLALITTDLDFSAVDNQGVIAVLFASVGTFGGFMMQMTVIKRFGVIAVSIVPFIIPLFAIFGGILLLGETFTPLMLVGIIIILSGIAIVQRFKRKLKAA